MVRIDLLDISRQVSYERKMPAPRAYTQHAPIKLTPGRCLKALLTLTPVAIISLVLAADRLISGNELLIGGVLAYTGISYLARALAIWRIYSRVSRGETIYVQNQTRQTSVTVPVAIVLTVLVLFVSLMLMSVLLAPASNLAIRIAAAFMSLMLWSMVIQCWKKALKS